MNIFFTQLRRRVVLFGLLAVLLAAVVAFQAISLSSLVAVWKQINAVSGQYTTIAVPREGTSWQALFYVDGEAAPLSAQETTYPALLTEDRRGYLTAHVTDCMSVSCYEKGYFSNDAYDMFSRSLVVMTGRCTEAQELVLPESRNTYDEYWNVTGQENYNRRLFTADFSLEEIVSEFPSYAESLPRFYNIHTAGPYPSDGKMPFEEGKTYLLFGCLLPSHKVVDDFDENGGYTYKFSNPDSVWLNLYSIVTDESEWTASLRGEYSDYLRSWTLVEGDDGVYYERMDEGTLPYCAEYSGTVEEFLNSKDGTIWRDTVLPFCKTNYESANVILTDNLNCVLWFNTGDASIFEGRSFEPTEYADGEDVCIISAAYALKNGLSVGDSVELDLYRAKLGIFPVLAGDFMPSTVQCNVYEPCKEENRLNIKKHYRIVGIYTAPEFATGEHAFSANTFFIPKASVPNAGRYESISRCLLYSLVLENGRIHDFMSTMKELGHANAFAYFDQDYNVLAETLDVMEGNAVRMVLLSGALFVLVAALFFFLFLRQTADPARKLRLLGVRAGAVRRQRYGAAVVLIVAAAALGAAGGAGLYGAVTKRVLSGNIALQPTALILAVAAQTAILLLAALLCTLATARQNLMQKK